MWFPQLGQSMLNELNKVCGGKKSKRKIARKPSLFPRLPGAAETADKCSSSHMVCVHCHILLRLRGHTANQCHKRPLAQHPAWAGTATARESPRGYQREGIPRAAPLDRLRGSIRQTFVIDGHGTPAWEERAPCRGRTGDMECGPPAHRVTSAVLFRVPGPSSEQGWAVSHRALWGKVTRAGKGHPTEHQDLPQTSPELISKCPHEPPLCPWPLTLPVTPPTAQVHRELVLLAFLKSLTFPTCLLQETSCYP